MMKKLLFLMFIPFVALSQQLSTENIFYDGSNREYIIYTPQSYSPSILTPILFAFHGGSGFANDFMNYEADFRSIADTANFILVISSTTLCLLLSQSSSFTEPFKTNC